MAKQQTINRVHIFCVVIHIEYTFVGWQNPPTKLLIQRISTPKMHATFFNPEAHHHFPVSVCIQWRNICIARINITFIWTYSIPDIIYICLWGFAVVAVMVVVIISPVIHGLTAKKIAGPLRLHYCHWIDSLSDKESDTLVGSEEITERRGLKQNMTKCEPSA